jgi:hypothetical protein
MLNLNPGRETYQKRGAYQKVLCLNSWNRKEDLNLSIKEPWNIKYKLKVTT